MTEDRTPRTPLTSGVALTAFLVAAGRAVDTHRSDALIDDPYAEAFVLAADLPVPMQVRPTEPVDGSEEESWQMMSGYMGVRTKFFDDALLRAAHRGCRQVVLLASGLDSRAYRLDWPAGTRVFELDQPAVLDFKDSVLKEERAVARSDHRSIRVDLREDWATALLRAGFDTDAPTAWLAEGLLPYLPAQAQQSLLSTVDALSAPGSFWGLEEFMIITSGLSDPVYQRIAARFGLQVLAEVLHDDDRPHPTSWLRQQGWAVDARLAREVARSYGRQLDPMTDRINGPVELIAAEKGSPRVLAPTAPDAS
jgi:methyltransferase (TIGR00027 family)